MLTFSFVHIFSKGINHHRESKSSLFSLSFLPKRCRNLEDEKPSNARSNAWMTCVWNNMPCNYLHFKSLRRWSHTVDILSKPSLDILFRDSSILIHEDRSGSTQPWIKSKGTKLSQVLFQDRLLCTRKLLPLGSRVWGFCFRLVYPFWHMFTTGVGLVFGTEEF